MATSNDRPVATGSTERNVPSFTPERITVAVSYDEFVDVRGYERLRIGRERSVGRAQFRITLGPDAFDVDKCVEQPPQTQWRGVGFACCGS